ncbi:MAG: TRAP transporter substrate-binding protein DctP [Ignavibacteriae bacterium]|nr:TRAP transporter substrate-binding protein DctP [Ignavibacteriota bacterium]
MSLGKMRFTFTLLALPLLFPLSLLGQQYTIKFATLAPEGSTWMNVMKEYDEAVRKESGGRLGFKIYPNGVQGDEKDVLRKIKLGQLHSAGITGNGMTTIASTARILDSPFLFKSYDEVDHIYKTFAQELNKAFEESGFINLGWAEVGFVYVFTNTPVRTPDDIKGVKMWMWEGDPIAEACFNALGIHPIPLSITDVLTSLQTKLIDGVYTPPLAAIALQWFTRVKYLINVPLADASGAVVISKKKFDELPGDLQELLVRNGKHYMQKLTKLSREENTKAIETLLKNGITKINPPSQEVLNTYDEIGKKARRLLVGKLFSEDLLNRVEQAVLEYRNNRQKSSK